MKHAFLVAAHHQFGILEKMLRIMDDESVDFFIHIDKKSTEFPEEKLRAACKKSKITFIERSSVYWGGVQPD